MRILLRGFRRKMTADLRVYAAQRLVSGSYRVRQLWCKDDTPSSSCCVEPGHELAVGGAGGGEVLVTLVEFRAEIGELLLEAGDLVVEGVDVGWRAEPGFAPGLLAERGGRRCSSWRMCEVSRAARSCAASRSACRDARVTAGPAAVAAGGGVASSAWILASRSGCR